jgi:hypothetical protein
MVVHVREKKTRLRDVDQEDSMGIAKREAKGRERGARRAERDILNCCCERGLSVVVVEVEVLAIRWS